MFSSFPSHQRPTFTWVPPPRSLFFFMRGANRITEKVHIPQQLQKILLARKGWKVSADKKAKWSGRGMFCVSFPHFFAWKKNSYDTDSLVGLYHATLCTLLLWSTFHVFWKRLLACISVETISNHTLMRSFYFYFPFLNIILFLFMLSKHPCLTSCVGLLHKLEGHLTFPLFSLSL